MQVTLVTKELVRLPNGSRSWTGTAPYREMVVSGGQRSWRELSPLNVIEKVGNVWAKSVLVSKTYVDTFPATWSESYDRTGGVKPAAYTLGRLYQGRYGRHNTIDNIWYDPIYWGVQRSLIGFNTRQIQEKLKGATVQKVELYLKNEHFWYARGGRASIVSHSFANRPYRFNHSASVANTEFVKGQAKWITLPVSQGNLLKNGSVSGYGLFRNSADLNYYGYFSGANTRNRPVLRITYSKNIYVSYNGQEILVDEPKNNEPKRVTYTVQSGDSLWSISNRYGVTVSQLQEWNKISGSTIHPGDVLSIYQSTPTSSVPAAVPKYTSVRRGEGLVQVTERLMRQGLLSQNFFTARQTLVSLNGFTTSAPMLHPGDQIMYSRS